MALVAATSTGPANAAEPAAETGFSVNSSIADGRAANGAANAKPRYGDIGEIPVVVSAAAVGFALLLFGFHWSLRRTFHRRTAALARSEFHLANAQRIAQLGSYDRDLRTGALYWSDEVYRIFGYQPGQVEPSFDFFIDRVHPDDRQRFRDMQDRAMSDSGKHEIQFRIVRPDGEERIVFDQSEVEFDAQGKPGAIRGAVRDVTEKVEFERQAEHIERRFLGAIDNLAERVALYDPEGRLVFCNKAYWSDAGPMAATMAPGDSFEALIREMVENGVMPDAAIGRQEAWIEDRLERFRNASGPVESRLGDRWLQIRNERMPDGSTIVIVSDISELKQREDALRESEQRYALAIAATNDGLWDRTISTGECYFSPRWHEIFGYGEGELRPHVDTFMELLHRDDRERVKDHVRAHLEDRAVYDIETRMRHKDGWYVWVRVKGRAVCDENGEPVRMTGSISDITARKRAEEALRESESRYRVLIETSPDPVFVDKDGTVVFANQAAAQAFGAGSPAELVGMDALELIHPDDHQHVAERRLQLSAKQEPNPLTQRRIRRLDGSDFDGEARAAHTVWDGEPAWIVIIRDVTVRNKAEKALRESEARFRDVSELTVDWVWETGPDLRFTWVSPRVSQALGRRVEYFIGKTREELGPPEDDFAGWERHLADLEAHRPISDYTFRRTDVHGKLRHVTLSGKPRFDSDGSFLGYRGTGRDLTAEVEARAETARVQERFLDAIDKFPDQIAFYDSDKRLIFYNQEFRNAAGSARDDLTVGMLLDDVLRTRFGAGVVPKAAKGREEEWIAERVRRFGTSSKPWEFERNGQIFETRDENLPDGGTIVIVANVTMRKQAENALRESEARLNAFFAHAPVGLVIRDTELRYTKVNETLVRLTDRPAENFVGKFSRDVLPPDVAAKLDIDLRETLKTGLPVLDRVIRVGVDPVTGRDKWRLSAMFPIFGNDGAVASLGTVIVDISDRMNAEEEVRRLNVDLEQRIMERTEELREAQEELIKKERLATLGQLTATVSHELRNPLGAMRTSIYVVRNGMDTEDNRTIRAVDRVERSITRCDKIIDELLDYTRITGIDFESVGIESWLGPLLDDQVVPHGLTIERRFETPGLIVPIDTHRLSRAVINIYDNACQAAVERLETDGNGGDMRVVVATRRNGGRVEIAVEDNGPGMTDDVMDRVFEPLFSTKGFGVGLGLPVVRQIMQQHDGGVEIETEPGRGTTVVLWLPVRDSAQPTMTENTKAPEEHFFTNRIPLDPGDSGAAKEYPS